MSERQRPQSKVSVEDLLRLKRAERPASEFWAQFDEQLRRKQLAAIVDKRPWWRRVSLASLVKVTVPVGTTAILALTLINARDRSQPAPAVPTVASASVSSSDSSSVNPATQLVVADADASRSSAAERDEKTRDVQATSRDGAPATQVHGHQLAENSGNYAAGRDGAEPSLAQVILGLEGTVESEARPDYQPEVAGPLLTSLNSLDAASAEMNATSESASFTQVSSSRNDRRARLLASLDTQDRNDMISGNSRVARSRERIASRLAEQSLYDSISRLGLNGDSVSIKF